MKRVFIHLPNGQKFEFSRKNPSEDLKEEDIDGFRELMMKATSFNIECFAGPNFDKKVALILYGDLLKNSFITAE